MANYTAENLILYSDNRLPCPQRVVITAAELGLKLTTIQIDILENEHNTPEYKSLNAFTTVPFLTSPSNSTVQPLTLRESRAIARYLCLLPSISATQTLLPSTKDIVATARFEEAASMEVTSFDPVANRLVFEDYFKPSFEDLKDGEKKDEKVVQELRERLKGVLDGMERVLEGRRYVAGETFTLVDIFYVPYMLKLSVLHGEELFRGRERLRGWWERVKGRESVKMIATYQVDRRKS